MEKATGNTRKLQLVSLEVLSFLDRICQEQGFTYYLAYGTLLGAVRHKGFIPWDDDIDVWMPRGDYMKLLEYLKNDNTDEHFGLSEGTYKIHGDRPAEFQMRIIDKTKKISRMFAGKDTVMYPWIDVFCLDVFPQQKKQRYLKNFKRHLFTYKIARCKHFLIEENSLFGKANKLIYTLHKKFHLFKHILNEEKQIQKTVCALTKYQTTDNTDYKEYFCYAAVYLQQSEKCFFQREWFAESVKVEFEGRQFSAPKNWDSVLKTLYNNYMQLPPEHKRKCTHSAYFIEE